MDFQKDKIIAFSLLVISTFTEYFHKLFDGILHSSYVNPNTNELTPIYWSDMIYYFFNESLTFILIVLVCVKLWTNRASKAIMSTLFMWFAIEWIEITLQMVKIIDIRTSTSNLATWQLFTSLTVWILVFFGSKKQI